MCGITGLWNLDKQLINKWVFDQFTDSLAHRGPDGRGVYINSEGSLALGHRRLAILDLLPTGHQPMSYANGRYWITYNGEIYNFLELRNELKGLGYQFNSDSDTEVILASYAQWGEDCQFKFNGMWAFAIWDSKERILFLSRDRFGVKPLHYFFDGKRFAFASEMKAFLFLDWFLPTFDPRIVASALTNPNTIEGTENCLIKGLKRLRGGHCLVLKQGQNPTIKRWRNTLDHLISAPVNFQEQVEQFRELFFDAVKIRMRSDVPLGTALSGGLDSSSVLCSMVKIRSYISAGQRQALDWQRAFIATFPHTSQDESRFSKEVIRHTNAIPVYKEIKPSEIIDQMDNILFQFEEISDMPGAAWMIYRELRRDGVFVSIDGHGGDELLAGYRHYLEMMMWSSLMPWPNLLKYHRYKAILSKMYPENSDISIPGIKDIFIQNFRRKLREYPVVSKLFYHLYTQLATSQKTNINTPWIRLEPEKVRFPDFEKDQAMMSQFGLLNRALYFDFHFTVLPTILRNFDRCSMSHGVEIRSPFMDWRIVCLSFSLPEESKLCNGFTKRILREAMKDILPELIRTRTSKIAFASPLVAWFKDEGMKSFVLDSVNSKTFLDSQIWNGPIIRDFVEKSYADGEFAGARRAWEYLQAMKIMQLFENKKQIFTRGINEKKQ